MLYQLKLAVLLALLCAPLALLSRYLFGEETERWPVAALIPAVFVPGIWPVGLTAGVAIHFIALWVWHLIRRIPPGYHFKAATYAIAAFGMTTSLTIEHAAANTLDAIQASNEAGWSKVAKLSPEGAFVARVYRACVEPIDDRPAGRLRYLQEPPKADPHACTVSTIAQARATRGDDFALAVGRVIGDLPLSMALSPEATAALDNLRRE